MKIAAAFMLVVAVSLHLILAPQTGCLEQLACKLVLNRACSRLATLLMVSAHQTPNPENLGCLPGNGLYLAILKYRGRAQGRSSSFFNRISRDFAQVLLDRSPPPYNWGQSRPEAAELGTRYSVCAPRAGPA